MNFDIAFYDFDVELKATDLYFLYSKYYYHIDLKPIRLEVRLLDKISITTGIPEDMKSLILSKYYGDCPPLVYIPYDIAPRDFRKELKRLCLFKFAYNHSILDKKL